MSLIIITIVYKSFDFSIIIMWYSPSRAIYIHVQEKLMVTPYFILYIFFGFDGDCIRPSYIVCFLVLQYML